MSVRQTEKRTVVIRIGKGIIIARKTMSHCASVTRRKRESLREFYRSHFCFGNPRLH